MGAHSAPTTPRFRHVAISGLIVGGATVAGAGVATAQPVIGTDSLDDLGELDVQGIDTGSLEGQNIDTGSLDAFTAPETGEDYSNVDGSEFGDIVGSIADQLSQSADAGANNDVGVAALEAAKTKIGARYEWGGNGPDAFDCSGLTSWAYKQAGVSIPRTAAQQAAAGTAVALDDLQLGDLVTFYEGASHVGIYAGDGQVLNAPTYGVPVSYAPIDSMPVYNAVRFR